MADVLIVCVREDETQAKALADMFEGAGFSVGGAPGNDAALRSSGAGIIVWSQASIRSRPFLDAAQRVVSAGKAVLACLIDPPPPDSVEHAPAFDLTGWTGAADDPSLDPLFFAVDRMINTARAAVGATTAPAPPQFQPPPQFQTPPPSLRAAPIDPPYARNPRSSQPSPPQTLPPGFQMRSARAPEPDPINAEAEHWRMIRHSKDPNDFFEYLAKYGPDGEFSEVAELRLKKLSPGAASSETNSLRNAARAAQAEPPRAYEPPPPRRPDPPPRRPEPPAAFEASRAYDPPPQIRPEPTPPPPRPREVHFERDHRPIDDRGAEAAKRDSGGARVFVMLLLIGAALIGGGFYLGMGDQLSAMFAAAPATEDAAAPGEAENLPPASAPEEVFASTEPAAPAPTPLREAAPTRAERAAAERAAAQARSAARTPSPVEVEPPTPAPQASWTTETASGGPVSLQPSTQASNVPSQVIPLAPPPSPTPVSTTPAETRPAATPARGAVRWAQRPSAQRISALYPSRALRTGANGSVMLDCVVRADFGPSCTVASESPRGAGFGAAALNAVTAYRAQPSLSDGSSAVGARTRISILFQQAPER